MASLRLNILAIYSIYSAFLFDGAVGLISFHLAFYQMKPWSTATSRILNLWDLQIE